MVDLFARFVLRPLKELVEPYLTPPCCYHVAHEAVRKSDRNTFMLFSGKQAM